MTEDRSSGMRRLGLGNKPAVKSAVKPAVLRHSDNILINLNIRLSNRYQVFRPRFFCLKIQNDVSAFLNHEIKIQNDVSIFLNHEIKIHQNPLFSSSSKIFHRAKRIKRLHRIENL